MAKKGGVTPKQQTSAVLSRLQESTKSLQKDASALLKRTRKQAVPVVSKEQQRAIDRVLKQAQTLRADLETRARRLSRDVEAQADRLLSSIETEATKRLRPLLQRLDLPSRQDLRNLTKRVAQLEKKLRQRDSKPTDSSSSQAAPKKSTEP